MEHVLTMPLTCSSGPAETSGSRKMGEDEESHAPNMDDPWLEPDDELYTPAPLRHEEKVKNLKFCRKFTSDFLDKLLQQRSRMVYSSYATPFVDYMVLYLKDEAGEDEAKQKDAVVFAINILASVRRFAREPDFLAYLLLLMGKLPD